MKNFPWHASYPQGVPHEINPDLYSSLSALFEECTHKYSDEIAFENMGKALTFKQVDDLSNAFAAYLMNEAELKKGDRIAIQMPNLLQNPIAIIGSLKAGLVVVNTNPLYTPAEMKHQFNDSEASAIVILANFGINLQKILSETQIKTVIVTEIGDMLGGLKGSIVNFVVKKVKKMVPDYSLPNAISFKTALKKGKGHEVDLPVLEGQDLAFLQYTGGTTGVSKGAMLTHRNMISNVEQSCAWFKSSLQENTETVITALPLYHIFALTANCLLMMKMGAKNVLITNPRDMPAFMKELSKHKFSVFTAVNTLFNGMMNQEAFAKLDFSHFKISVGGGMAVQKAVAERWKEMTGVPIAEGYGLTETSPVLCCNRIDGNERIGTIGLPLPSTEIKLLNDEGEEVAVGEAGELCARGPQVMKGYWNREQDTKDVFVGEFFKTGDIAVTDAEGYFRIVDRKKEMILVSGFNVYPNEVENAIASNDKVLEVGVVGVPDAKSTEAVKAFVVKKDDSLTEEELKAFCKDCLTGYKRPKYVEFKKELPKSNVGKILRRILKEEDAKINRYV